MTAILKAMNPSEDSFLLPPTLTVKVSAAPSINATMRPPAPGSPVPMPAYASVARAATIADDTGSDMAAAIEEERRVRQVEFEKRIKLAEDEARARGLEEGLLQGIAQGREEWMEQVERAKQVLISLAGQQRDFSTTLEDELVALVFVGVTRIVGTTSASMAAVKEIVRRAIAEDSGRLIVRVAPDDFELLSTALKGTAIDDLEVAPDPRVVLGGCILESDRGTLDARLETQIEQVRKTLLAMRTPSVER